ncbi:MAG: PIG-L family deacetylase [Acidimicrobiales bacterium]
MAEPLTLMAVHAHPDDECIGTGGVLARYAAEGVRTVVVTCTDGRCGDGPGGLKPGDTGHHPEAVVAVRQVELERSCALLGVDALELLGHHDSGMMGWPTNDAPGAFWKVDVLEAAKALVGLIERHRPQVVVTYDANGFYGHPDHIMTHRVAMAAVAASGIPTKLYYSAMPRSALARFAETMRDAGVEPPTAPADNAEAVGDSGPQFGTSDALVTTAVDVSNWTRVKRDALAAHASQTDNAFFLTLPQEAFDRLFATEGFTLAVDRLGVEVPETDLFAGVR